MIIHADLFDALPPMYAESFDSCVCDPPYGLEFMGKEWDKLGATAAQASEKMDASHPFRDGAPRIRYGKSASTMQDWHERWALEVYRVLKPGGYLLAFGGTRTFHRLTCAIEDAGFEIRDCLCWLYGSGFPKSLDVSKAIDERAGAERDNGATKTAPATEEAKQLAGWGTALKPAWEPVIMARKPLMGTVAANVVKHGTGGINIDACRIGESKAVPASASKTPNKIYGAGMSSLTGGTGGSGFNPDIGRWPANVVFSHSLECRQVTNLIGDMEWLCANDCAVAMLDAQSGEMTSGTAVGGLHRGSDKHSGRTYGPWKNSNPNEGDVCYGDTGGASRFFYCAKPSREERDLGCDHLKPRTAGEATDREDDTDGLNSPRAGAGRTGGVKNFHPTVKPLELMRWLVKMVTPKGGKVLDPFGGSGTTGMACAAEGFDFVLIEREADYIPIIKARIRGIAPLFYSDL